MKIAQNGSNKPSVFDNLNEMIFQSYYGDRDFDAKWFIRWVVEQELNHQAQTESR
jgi:hypothetical protein